MPLRRLLATLACALLGAPSVAAADHGAPPRRPCWVTHGYHDDSRGSGYVVGLSDDALEIIETTVAVGRREVVAVLRLATTRTDDELARHWRLAATLDGTELEFTVHNDLGDRKQVPAVRAGGEPVRGTFAVHGNAFVWRVALDRLPRAGRKAPARWIPLRATTSRLGLTYDTVAGEVPRRQPRGCGACAR